MQAICIIKNVNKDKGKDTSSQNWIIHMTKLWSIFSSSIFRKKHYAGQIVLTNHPFNNSGILYKILCHPDEK